MILCSWKAGKQNMANEPMYKKIYEDLLNGIKEGTYPPGGRLPSEKELIDMYQVSRITVKKALEILAYRGCILRKPGKGSFVVFEDNLRKALQSEDLMQEDKEIEEQGAEPADGRLKVDKSKVSANPMIGVIFDSFGVSFGCELIKGVEYECRKRGFLMLFRCTYGSKEAESCAIHEMIQNGAKGLILMCSQREVYNETVLELYMNKFPLILLDREMAGISLPVVTTDNYKASCELTAKLIEEGHKRICFVFHSYLDTTTVKERFNGYRDTMLGSQLAADVSEWVTENTKNLPDGEEDFLEETESYSKLTEYIQNNRDITAYYAVDHELGMILYRIMQNLGLEKEKTIAFFDGFEENMDPLPIFPHVMQDQYQMGVVAVRLLARRLKGETVTGRENIPYTIEMPK